MRQVAKFIFISLILYGFNLAQGASLSLNPNFPSDNIAGQKSIVQVMGILKGSGILILLDNLPVILTNSHISQGLSSVRVSIPHQAIEVWNSQTAEIMFLNSSAEGQSRVLLDFPKHDFAILSLPDSLTRDAANLLPLLAKANGTICTGRATHCPLGFHPGPQAFSVNEIVGAIIDGKPTKFELLAHWTSSLSTDQVISGDPSTQIWTIPLYSRPGVSGGAFYHNGVLAGVVTKVSYSGEPEAYATSMDSIASVIAEGPQSENASWASTPSGQLLQVHDESDTIQVSPNGTGGLGNAGGEGGNGGGEGGNGGGQYHDLYWKLSTSDDAGKHDATILNPFAAKPSSLLINQRKVAYFEIKNGYFGNPVKMLPTLALYLWYRHNDAGAMQVKYVDEDVLPLLEKKRTSANESFMLARNYVLLPNSERYKLMTFNKYNQQNDGSVALYPDQSGHWPENSHLWGFPKNPDHGGLPAELDSDGYYKPVNQAISAKPRSKGAIIDVKIQSAFLVGITPDDYRITKLKITADFSQVIVTTNIPGKPETKLILPRLPSTSIGNETYGMPGSSCQAIVIFDSHNLERLDRSFIKLEHAIFEFANCTPGKDCVR